MKAVCKVCSVKQIIKGGVGAGGVMKALDQIELGTTCLHKVVCY